MNFKDYQWGYCRWCHRDVAVHKDLSRVVRLNKHHKAITPEVDCPGGYTVPTTPRPELTIDQEAAMYAQWCKSRVKETLSYVNPYTGQLEGPTRRQPTEYRRVLEGEA